MRTIGIRTEKLPNENMQLTANNDTRQYLREFRDLDESSQDLERRVADLAGLTWIAPEWIGALTSAPIYADNKSVKYVADTDHPVVDGKGVWWHERYQLESMTDRLIQRGRIVLPRAGD